MSNVQPLLRGKPVFVMNKGHFPNKSDINNTMQSHPGCVVRTEHIYTPKGVRFAITVAKH